MLSMPLGREPDLVIGPRDAPYMERWFIRKGHQDESVYLHKISRSDDERALHDHRSDNESIILDGEYIEHIADPSKSPTAPGWNLHAPREYHRFAGDRISRPAEQPHRLELIDNKPVWTLWIKSGDRRDWGFWVPNGSGAWGWMQWQEYHRQFGTEARFVGEGYKP